MTSLPERFYPQQLTCQIPDLWFLLEQTFGRMDQGKYVEVGAFDGLFASNSWGLAMRGWSGTLIEPVPRFAQKAAHNYRNFPNVTVLNHAITDKDDSQVSLRIAGPLTSGHKTTSERYQGLSWAAANLTNSTIKVSGETLDTTLSKISIDPGFEVLIVDVEGMEEQVFSGFDLSRWRPTMLIVELADTHPDLYLSSPGHPGLKALIEDSGYRIAYKDRVNTVFVRANHV